MRGGRGAEINRRYGETIAIWSRKLKLDSLVAAVRTVAMGGRYFSADVSQRLLRQPCMSGPAATPRSSTTEGSPRAARYVPFVSNGGPALAKQQVFEHATSDAVLCIDCHIFLVPGAIHRLLDFYDANPECPTSVAS